jgi:hypothetical protein
MRKMRFAAVLLGLLVVAGGLACSGGSSSSASSPAAAGDVAEEGMWQQVRLESGRMVAAEEFGEMSDERFEKVMASHEATWEIYGIWAHRDAMGQPATGASAAWQAKTRELGAEIRRARSERVAARAATRPSADRTRWRGGIGDDTLIEEATGSVAAPRLEYRRRDARAVRCRVAPRLAPWATVCRQAPRL